MHAPGFWGRLSAALLVGSLLQLVSLPALDAAGQAQGSGAPTALPTATPSLTRSTTGTPAPAIVPTATSTPTPARRVAAGTAAVRIVPATLSLATGNSGTVTVEAALPTGTGLAGWTVDVTYNAVVLAATVCTSSLSTCNTVFAPDKVRITGASTPELSGTQTLASLTFQALGAAGTSSPLTLAVVDFADASGAAISTTTSDGTINVVGPTVAGISPSSGPGKGETLVTISGSNFVSGATVSLGGRAATDVTVASATSITARTPAHSRTVGDVNGSGSVTSLDALCILRLVAALPATTACPADKVASAVDVVVANPYGQSGTLAGGFTYQHADVNGNGSVTSVDALCVLRQVAALPPTTACPAPGGTITTVAGTFPYGGDSGLAATARLAYPEGVAVGPDGSLYIADTRNYRLRKVSPAGIITTIAGTGSSGFSGDGGPATSAQLSALTATAVGPDGSVYLADTDNYRIRKVSPAGTISTVAGNGGCCGGDGGPATSAGIDGPWGVAVAGDGSLYIAERWGNRIRKVNPAGTISTLAGNGEYGFSGDGGSATSAQLRSPEGVAVGVDGSVYIADTDNNRIRKVSPDGTIGTVAGTGCCGSGGDGGPATSAQLGNPQGVAIGADGSLYIADGNGIRKVNTGGIISRLAGGGAGFSGDGGPATSARLNNTRGAALGPDGSVYVADTYNARVRRIAPDGTIATAAGIGTYWRDGGPASEAPLSNPWGVAVGADGTVYIGDMGNNRVRGVSPSGTISTVAGSGSYGSSGDGGPATSAQLGQPFGVAVGGDGSLYIADADNRRVRRVNPASTISTVAGNGDCCNGGDGGPATSAQLSSPSGVGVGLDGSVYIADSKNGRIRKVSPDGTISTVAGTGGCCSGGDGGPAINAQLSGPSGVAIGADGSLYIADTHNNRIRKASPDGIITTLAGTGRGDFGGDGGPAASAWLNNPRGVALGPDGSVYVAEGEGHRVRRIWP